MPRANRYILAGCIYHLTHRCHDRSFLFRFAKDRTEYCRRLRLAVKEFGVSLLGSGEVDQGRSGTWFVREEPSSYGAFSGPKS